MATKPLIGANTHDAPVGSVAFELSVPTNSSTQALLELGLDVERYATIEPVLHSARWLDAPRTAGARAEVEGAVPFSLPIVERLIGHPVGIARLEQYEPAGSLTYTLVTARAVGFLHVAVLDAGASTHVAITGWFAPRSWPARLALAPLAPLLATLATRAARTVVMRADAALEGGA